MTDAPPSPPEELPDELPDELPELEELPPCPWFRASSVDGEGFVSAS
jgi:hypothetical protein